MHKATAQQAADTTLPYKQYPEMPAFNIRLMDSLSIFNTFNIPKGQKTLLFYFDPECRHCKDVTTALLRGIDSLSDVNIYFFTAAISNTRLKEFNERFGLAKYPNIKVVGRDYELFFLDYYRIHYIPSLALYDEKKKFIHLFEGGTTVQNIYDYVHPKQ